MDNAAAGEVDVSARVGGVEPVGLQALQSVRPQHTAFADFHAPYVAGCISLADTKTTVLFGAVAASLTYFFSKDTFAALVFSPEASFESAAAIATTVFLAISALLSVMVLAPRLTHSEEGLVFFGSVACFENSSQYLNEIANRTEAELTAARIRHSYDVSRICAQKFLLLRRAMWLGFAGGMSSIPLLKIL